jgi:hypothetical protein
MSVASPHGELLVDSLGDVLSETALGVLRRAGVRRDAAETCDRSTLERALVERGLPLHASVLEFEARCGGAAAAEHRQSHLFGVERLGCWAALRRLEVHNRDQPAGTKAIPLTLEIGGRTLLPISTSVHNAASHLWMDDEGTIYLCDDVEHGGLADSYRHLLEREALKLLADESAALELRWTALPTMTDEDVAAVRRLDEDEDDEDDEDDAQYERNGGAPHDRAFAAAAGFPLFGPGSDRWNQVWFGDGRLLYPKYPWRGDVRVLAAPDLESMIALAQVANRVRPSVAATWRGSFGDAPRPGETVAARLPAYCDREGNVGELAFIAGASGPRVHLERYEAPRSVYRLWEARRRSLAPG